MPATPAPEPPTMRERYRAQVRREVKQAALRQLAESGPGGVSVSAIGKQLGVSGPALYRYFASRDELLTELVIDAYHDLAAALSAAASAMAAGTGPGSARPARGPRARLPVLGAGPAAPVPAAVRAAAARLRRARATTRGSGASRDEPAARRSAASSATAPPPRLPSRSQTSSRPGRKNTTPASTLRPRCAPSSPGAACTAW